MHQTPFLDVWGKKIKTEQRRAYIKLISKIKSIKNNHLSVLNTVEW